MARTLQYWMMSEVIVRLEFMPHREHADAQKVPQK